MIGRLYLLCLVLLPALVFSQVKGDTAVNDNITNLHSLRHRYYGDSAFSFMASSSMVFYTAKDQRINKFMGKYGYVPPKAVPVGIRFEISTIPFGSKMVYSINGATILSRQDISTADFSLSAYHFIIATKNIWLTAGIALGGHFDRIVLNKSLPPAFDSLANEYRRTLSLHRSGFIVSPGAKAYWFPLQRKKFQIGIFSGIGYDLDFNSHWKLGYYPQNSNTFRKIKRPSNVGTVHEYGWVMSAGLTVCF